MASSDAPIRLLGVIGHPIAQSLSPVIMAAAIESIGLDWVYLAFDVPPHLGADAVAAVRALDMVGANVTMPHKDEAARSVDRLTGAAAALGAVNCIVNEAGTLVGENTDGDGFIWSLRRESIDVDGRRCVVFGAGGAARAVIRSLALHGASEVVVVNRTPERARAAADLAGTVGRVGALGDVAAADLVVNATSVGMDGVAAGESVVPVDVIGAHQVVVDLVYHPVTTPLLAAAAHAGATQVGGIGMLVGQAAVSFERWSGKEAPFDAMLDAAARAIGPT